MLQARRVHPGQPRMEDEVDVRRAARLLVARAVLHEGVVEDDALVAAEAVHVCVAVPAALAAVHLKELPQREVHAARERLDAAPQRAVRQGLVRVEERRNERGVRSEHHELQRGEEGPEVEGHVGAGDAQDVDERRQDGRQERRGERELHAPPDTL